MWTCLFLLLGIPAISPPFTEGREATLPLLEKQLKNWTDTFGQEIFNFGNIVTKYPEIQRRFQTSPDSEVRKVDLKHTVSEMANETYVGLKEKVDAIKKIMNFAEEKALEHYEKSEELRGKPPSTYLNAKKLNYNPTVDMSAKEIEKAKQDDPLLKRTLEVRDNEHFVSSVNLNVSSVHVPSSVFDRREDILDGIHWSSEMDKVFKSNYEKNPTLLWQYFGSSTGFFRQYPAMKWPNDNTNKNYPDMYDCRTRPWYTAAANSPKNMVILQDVSGSMMGLRREIARHVVYTILDTLSDNDYVNVFNFTDDTHPVVPCYKDTLIQANLENVREFKVALDQSRTIGMSNFTEALEVAYNLLEKHRDLDRADSANCNEAIMLITDGAPETFSEVYNPRNEKYGMGRTRIFTYLIGREMTDHTDMLNIACENKGYYTHVTTLGEVQEQVLKYLAVMSKPMVMSKIHSVAWTPVYADIVEIAESDWLWNERNRGKQSERSIRYKTFLKKVGNDTEGQEFYVVAPYDDTKPPGKKETKRIAGRRVAEYLDYGMTNPTEEELREMFAREERQTKNRQYRTRELINLSNQSHPRPPGPRAEAITAKKQNEIIMARKMKHAAEQENLAKWGPNRKFRFMVSVSLPVFDQRNTTETMMSVNKEQANNETHSVEEAVKEKIAIFLGVVGTDIPIAEFQKVATPFKVGVNGYAFAITENGYVLFHPEWKPLLTDLLKPNYNAVDLSEVELADNDRYHRNHDPNLMEMRMDMISMETGDEAHNRTLEVRIPQDDFKRVVLKKQQYAYAKIPNTTYTLAFASPVSHLFKFHGEIELRRDGHGKNVTHFFEVPDELRHWRVNPDWTYCEYIRGDHPEFKDNQEGLVLHFLREIQNATNSWAWRNTGIGIQRHTSGMDSDIYSCDKELVQSLVFDANVTGVFNLKWLRSYKSIANESFARQIVKKFGAVVAFIATRSGLTRWVNYTDSPSYVPFSHSDIRATEEIWYKRAVDRYEVDRGLSYVLSVPYDAGTREDSLVTATRALFVHRNGQGGPNHRYAPAGVAGVQFEHMKMARRFFEIASTCDGSGCLKCDSNTLDCYVIDDNGYVVISNNHEDTGRFLGEVDGGVMEKLVDHGIYKRVRVVDYQGMCLHLFTRNGFGFALDSPFTYFRWIIKWFIGRMAWLALQINLHSYFSPDFSSVLAEAILTVNDEVEVEDNPNWHPYLELASINKTRLRPCHKEYLLYAYGPKYFQDLYYNGYHPGILRNCDSSGAHTGFFGVHLINRTNLIMVAVDGKCARSRSRINLSGSEVQYELDEELENMTAQNDVIAQICRVPIIHLQRKRPSAKCLYFNEDEKDLRTECGGKTGLQSTLTLTLLSIILISIYNRIL